METLIAETFCFYNKLSDSEISKYETSNNVLISNALFEEILNNHEDNNKMLILGLYYNNKKIFVNISGNHHNNDNLIYLPLWIYQYFNYTDGEQINYMQVSPKIGSRIKIKPHEDFYAFLPDPVQALRDGFEQYSILLKNTTIPLNINGRTLLIDIIDTNSNNNPINIRGIELEVEIEEIVKEEIKQEIKPEILKEEFDFSSMLPPSYQNSLKTPENKFPGTGNKLGT
jgi:hypothetical protein